MVSQRTEKSPDAVLVDFSNWPERVRLCVGFFFFPFCRVPVLSAEGAEEQGTHQQASSGCITNHNERKTGKERTRSAAKRVRDRDTERSKVVYGVVNIDHGAHTDRDHIIK